MNDFDFSLLQSISLPSYDNGEHFTDTTRLDMIKRLSVRTPYQFRYDSALFTLFSKHAIECLPEFCVILSTHIDACDLITQFYAEQNENGILHGIFDNTLTNAAALSAMFDGNLSDNVLIAFTGDEENNANGASQLIDFLQSKSKLPFVIVLDVTNIGYNQVSITVENKFYFKDSYHQAIKDSLHLLRLPYRFVAYNPFDIPDYVPLGYVEKNSDGGIYEALCDESWKYHERGIECFSLCIPIDGEMHDNCGVLSRKTDFPIYKQMLVTVANKLALSTF